MDIELHGNHNLWINSYMQIMVNIVILIIMIIPINAHLAYNAVNNHIIITILVIIHAITIIIIKQVLLLLLA